MRRPVTYVRPIILSLVVAAATLMLPGYVRADAGLQLNPLRYDDVLSTDAVKNGFIDVANPSDTTVTIKTSVRGFRQADLDGNLAFFDDAALREGIIPGLKAFDLGPRESVRVVFTVNPVKLPRGGVYAAVFFSTVPQAASSATSFITETANVGTLLILRNGGTGVKSGQIGRLALPFFQFGSAVRGQVVYHNTNRDTGGLAFAPKLEVKVLPWGTKSLFDGPFVMPTSSRRFDLFKPGSFLGLLPVTVHDQVAGDTETAWVLAMTGWYRTLVPIVLALIVGILAFYLKRKVGMGPRPGNAAVFRIGGVLRGMWRRLRGGKPVSKKRPLDGVSRKA